MERVGSASCTPGVEMVGTRELCKVDTFGTAILPSRRGIAGGIARGVYSEEKLRWRGISGENLPFKAPGLDGDHGLSRCFVSSALSSARAQVGAKNV